MKIPLVNYLVLDSGEPHLQASECQNCGALALRKPIQCGSCFTKGPFEPKDLATTGTLRAFTVVKRGAMGNGFISAIVDFDGGGNAKGNLLNGDLDNFENNKLGEPVRLVTFTVDTDDEGNEAVAFGFEKV
ncbi:MAG: Zn-ribbon domain-containing OB-fold protein [Acidimicrobiia bacterium]